MLWVLFEHLLQGGKKQTHGYHGSNQWQPWPTLFVRKHQRRIWMHHDAACTRETDMRWVCLTKSLAWDPIMLKCWRLRFRHVRRKFRSQTSDNMDRWKAEQGRGREKRKIRREKSRRERVRRKKMEMREKVGKSRFTVFFQWFVAPEGRKVGSLKRRVRSQLARWEMKNCTPLWREAHVQVKMYKTHHCRTTFGSCDVEKVHAVVARSTFRSQNVKNTIVGPLLEVAMSKKCTALWREAHFEVKMLKTPGVRTTFGSCDVEKVYGVVARSTFGSNKC